MSTTGDVSIPQDQVDNALTLSETLFTMLAIGTSAGRDIIAHPGEADNIKQQSFEQLVQALSTADRTYMDGYMPEARQKMTAFPKPQTPEEKAEASQLLMLSLFQSIHATAAAEGTEHFGLFELYCMLVNDVSNVSGGGGDDSDSELSDVDA